MERIIDLILNNQEWAIGIGVVLLITIFSKFAPTKKIGDKIFAFTHGIGGIVSKFILRYIPGRSAEKIENGIINTILVWCEMAIKGFRTGMLEDNK